MSEKVTYNTVLFEDSITNSSVLSNDASAISDDIQQFLDIVDDRILGYYDSNITNQLSNYTTTFNNDSDNMQQFGRWLNDTYDDYKMTSSKVNEIVSDLKTNELDGSLGNVGHKAVEDPTHTENTPDNVQQAAVAEKNSNSNTNSKDSSERDRESLLRHWRERNKLDQISDSQNADGLKAQAASITSNGSANGSKAGIYASLVGAGLSQAIEGVDAILDDKKDEKSQAAEEVSEEKKMQSGPGTTQEEEKEKKNDNMLLGMGVGLAAAAFTGKFVLSDDEEDKEEEKAIEKYMAKEEKK